jgi:uncharacterized protein (DUF2141 family)
MSLFKLFLLFLSIQLTVFAPDDNKVNLTIHIKEIRNNKGNIILELRNGKKKFVKGITKKVKDKKCTIIIKNLKPGKYSYKYFHDENKNKKLDTGFMGIPKEGYGFSNNASGKFGPPAFKKTVFSIKKSSKHSCKPYYINL